MKSSHESLCLFVCRHEEDKQEAFVEAYYINPKKRVVTGTLMWEVMSDTQRGALSGLAPLTAAADLDRLRSTGEANDN